MTGKNRYRKQNVQGFSKGIKIEIRKSFSPFSLDESMVYQWFNYN